MNDKLLRESLIKAQRSFQGDENTPRNILISVSFRLISLILCIVMMLSCAACGDAGNKPDNPANDNQQSSDQEDETPSYLNETPTIVVSGSDFQSYGGNNAQERAESAGKTFSAILRAIKKDYPEINGFLFAGDYEVDIGQYVGTASSQAGINELRRILHETYGNSIDEVYVEGNHDIPDVEGLSESGANDPASGAYGVFVIHEDDYMWGSNTGWSEKNAGSGKSAKDIISETAANLKEYLDSKLDEGFNKPIFIISHVPLHYCMRTRNDGDGKYADLLFNVIDEACNSGLDVIYLFGHDHSQGWDDYLGGSSIYLSVGSNINIADSSQTDFTSRLLSFTYMNAGYVGYYDNHNGTDDALTMCVYEIYSDRVIIKRYSAEGVHDLKACGVPNFYKSESTSLYRPDKTVVTSPQTILLGQEKAVSRRITDDATGVAVTSLSKSITVSETTADDFSTKGYAAYKAYSITTDADFTGYATVELPISDISGRVRIYALDGNTYASLEHENSEGFAIVQTDLLDKIVLAVSDGEEKVYRKVTCSASELTDGDYIIVYDGNRLMIPSVVEKSGSTGNRVGYDLVSYSISDVIDSDVSDYAWTLTKNGDTWLLGSEDGYAAFKNTSGKAITAILDADGSKFTISGSNGKYTFSADGYVLNYNSRGLINGYPSSPASLELYMAVSADAD